MLNMDMAKCRILNKEGYTYFSAVAWLLCKLLIIMISDKIRTGRSEMLLITVNIFWVLSKFGSDIVNIHGLSGCISISIPDVLSQIFNKFLKLETTNSGCTLYRRRRHNATHLWLLPFSKESSSSNLFNLSLLFMKGNFLLKLIFCLPWPWCLFSVPVDLKS